MGEKERLAVIMDKEGLTAKEFAARVGISPATMSNIMQGRNNPSLEVVQKVLNCYRGIESDWLLFGSGPMYRNTPQGQTTIFDEVPTEDPADLTGNMPANSISKTPSGYPLPAQAPRNAEIRVVERAVAKKIQAIMIFYEDGTYQEIEVS